eukprot:gnl/TRDRNA2_/TRDRNA2_170832_c0_seq1.p1 gnl/TRDRNA2_/TRDRNA2_170832_c0~~gnl/TRDRNA2_/TRDRNA2_170832_c0_seq1.p1  ORF type:complete len:113 (-),score=7.21 gnl/TRDRNA2_/TRDRNA2_170832_c0_seq1:330-668(-)
MPTGAARATRCCPVVLIVLLVLRNSNSAHRYSQQFVLLKSCVTKSITQFLKSSPPKCTSPTVAGTLKIPSSIVSKVISDIPPPMSQLTHHALSTSRVKNISDGRCRWLINDA